MTLIIHTLIFLKERSTSDKCLSVLAVWVQTKPEAAQQTSKPNKNWAEVNVKIHGDSSLILGPQLWSSWQQQLALVLMENTCAAVDDLKSFYMYICIILTRCCNNDFYLFLIKLVYFDVSQFFVVDWFQVLNYIWWQLLVM